MYPKINIIWHGTDALKLVMTPPLSIKMKLFLPFYRLFWKIFWKIADKHLVHDKYKKRALVEFGISEDKIEVKHTGITDKKVNKIKHSGYNVLFYLPKEESKYKKWIYGKEYYEKLKKELNVNWIIADGTLDMRKVYPIVDCYIKINRTVYNGLGRMAEECKQNKIRIIEINAYRECFTDHVNNTVKIISKLSQNSL